MLLNAILPNRNDTMTLLTDATSNLIYVANVLGSVAHVQSCVIFGAISACVPAAPGHPSNCVCLPGKHDLCVDRRAVWRTGSASAEYVYPVNIRR